VHLPPYLLRIEGSFDIVIRCLPLAANLNM